MSSKQKSFLRFKSIFLLCILMSPGHFARTLSRDELKVYRDRVAGMFEHAYNGYLKYAYPYDELRPITCDGHDTWGSYSLTLIDALDTLVVMGNYSEFRRVASLLTRTLDFDKDINVSVFETNIRVIGGLLSAHLLSKKAGMELEDGWPCSGPLLRLAEKVATKLLPAFNTSTGMPYGTVNLKYGVPKGETPVACTAGVGTFILEFGALTRLTGNRAFEDAAMKALQALWESRSEINLVGNHIDVKTGKWTALDAGIGAGVDSYFEYLVKGSILFQYPELMKEFHVYEEAIEKYLKKEDWYMWAHMGKGSVTLPVFQSLECFWPGVQSLIGETDKAMKTLHNYHQVWKQYGFVPEFYNIPKSETQAGREGYPLRPELIESVMYLYQATEDPYLLEVAVDILESIQHSTRTRCGYSTVKDVRDHKLDNRMESFFLSETTKYLYLLFDPDNFIHNTGDRGTFIQTPSGQCVVDTGYYVFNTEAHPIDGAALYCCSAEKVQDDLALQNLHDNIDLLTLFDLVDSKDDIFERRGRKMMKPKSLKSQLENEGIDRIDRTPSTSPTVVEIAGDNVIRLDMKQLKKWQAGEGTEGGITSVLSEGTDSSNFQELMKSTLKKAIDLLNQIGQPATKDGDFTKGSRDLTQSSSQHPAGSDSEVPHNVQQSDSEPKIESESELRIESETGTDSCPSLADGIIQDDTVNFVKTSQDAGLKLKSESKIKNEIHKKGPEPDEAGWTRDDFPARLFTCPVKPFHSRLSLLGEMFEQ